MATLLDRLRSLGPGVLISISVHGIVLAALVVVCFRDARLDEASIVRCSFLRANDLPPPPRSTRRGSRSIAWASPGTSMPRSCRARRARRDGLGS
ncbi:MAG: hypothetical protein U1E76_14390 [Planctomycetota bacterium]